MGFKTLLETIRNEETEAQFTAKFCNNTSSRELMHLNKILEKRNDEERSDLLSQLLKLWKAAQDELDEAQEIALEMFGELWLSHDKAKLTMTIDQENLKTKLWFAQPTLEGKRVTGPTEKLLLTVTAICPEVLEHLNEILMTELGFSKPVSFMTQV